MQKVVFFRPLCKFGSMIRPMTSMYELYFSKKNSLVGGFIYSCNDSFKTFKAWQFLYYCFLAAALLLHLSTLWKPQTEAIAQHFSTNGQKSFVKLFKVWRRETGPCLMLSGDK